MGLFKEFIKRIFKIAGLSITRISVINNDDHLKAEEITKDSDLRIGWIKKDGFKTVIDIGANVGQFALKFRNILPDALIYSFEPLPEVYEQLLENFNGDSLFRGYNCALGTSTEENTIYLNEYSPSSSLLKMGNEHKAHFDFAVKETPVVIKMNRLDDIFSGIQLEEPILIKMDVQGFENQVIDGGLETLMKCKMLIIEVSFKELYQDQPVFDDIYQKLKSIGLKYSGNYEQLISPKDGEILQADAIFIR